MIIGGAALYAVNKKRKHDLAVEITKELGEGAAIQSPTKNDLELDADGGVLQEAVKESFDVSDSMYNEDDGAMEDQEII